MAILASVAKFGRYLYRAEPPGMQIIADMAARYSGQPIVP
ncbi:hypothetical protein MPS_2891 [Mycobacterium pseudoshottsii JCM 15466]|nr:hypothetical protein MMSP_5274 [Mycobacterium sp. 012931]EPQ71545.1 hypothetical protein MMMB2_5379 [Mycobacterium marinum MB2]EPQ73013.1 hypothetical protein MMEU_4395 [Mycobacterium marinum str. Europe]GAQ35892.1 hypothetical protein MPS_2891 [Mycobacterium pseudoshottsii JCM 15466]